MFSMLALLFYLGTAISMAENLNWIVHRPSKLLNNGTLVAALSNESFIEKCEFVRTLNKHSKRFLSIDFESLYAIEHFFWGMANGLTLELGALDGSSGNSEAPSQTGDFVDFGWSRIIIDANPAYRGRMKKHSADAFSVNAAICSLHHQQERKVNFVSRGNSRSPSAGVLQFMTREFVRDFYPFLLTEGGGVSWGASIDVNLTLHSKDYPSDFAHSEIYCLPLQRVFEQAGNVHHINFFVLDVEGGELEVLRSIAWKQVRFDVLCIETEASDQSKKQYRSPGQAEKIKRLLELNGYAHIHDDRRNSWYVLLSALCSLPSALCSLLLFFSAFCPLSLPSPLPSPPLQQPRLTPFLCASNSTHSHQFSPPFHFCRYKHKDFVPSRRPPCCPIPNTQYHEFSV